MHRFPFFASLSARVLSNLFVVLIILLSGCDSDEEELTCDSYFLKEVRHVNSKVTIYYNEDGLIDAMIDAAPGNVVRQDYFYNDKLQLVEVKMSTGYSVKFTYNAEGQLESCLNGAVYGSKLQFYYDEQGRMIKREHAIVDPYSSTPKVNYYTLEYPDSRTVKAKFFKEDLYGVYKPDGVRTYTLDENPRPYPNEYYLLLLALGNVVLDHNQLSLEVTNFDLVQSFTESSYEYNKDGYPKKREDNIYEYSSYDYSCEPVFEPNF